ncbi:hypothetical protein HPB51_006094 [Rhipicephalus microplus]|uniref:CCHC-type domain-containing protein n=1 Tax=Rhipicephalus microplus TaxID=6941 RepID=A0A9J6ER05_RHIMP|nr:hypothetical protein HPB51_006094 [Rhipicephalus microplus]
MEVHRIKETTTVVVLFSGLKVPNYVMCGSSMLRCTLYRRQTDICYECGALGHRANVCPTPTKKVCRGCAVNDPANDHQCQPTRALCRGPHLTADKSCQHRFQVPYLVRRQRRRRKAAKKRRQHQEGLTSRDWSVTPTSKMHSPSPAVKKSRSRSRGRSRSKRRAHSKGCSHSKGRSHSRLRFQEAPKTWADRSKPSPAQQPEQVTRAPLPEQKEDPRIAFLLQENASLKAQLQQMRVEFEALNNTVQALVRSLSVEPRRAKRKIGVEGEVAAASDLDVLGAIKYLQ